MPARPFTVFAAMFVPGRRDGHPQRLDGSDHPLAGILPQVARELVVRGALPAQDADPALRAIRVPRALPFDPAPAHGGPSNGTRFAGGAFETRSCFVNPT